MNWEILSEVENMGGAQFFYFIETDKILTIPRQKEGKIGLITLKPTNDYSAGYSVPGTLELSIDKPESDQGSYYDVVLTGEYPKLSAAMLANMNDMANRKYLVLCKDSNDRTRILGSLEDPLKFSFTERTGKQASDKSGVTFKFTGKSVDPPWHYSVVISAPANTDI